jgi:hypothetical protein
MRSGGSHAKGSAFERAICVQLSLWVTSGGRADIFSRNVLSGGSFTNQLRKGKELNTPGDITGVHPAAYKFLDVFMVECKHHKNIHIEHYLFDTKGTSFLSQTIELSRKQGKEVKRHYMVIAKENNRPTLLFMSLPVLECALLCKMRRGSMRYHLLHNKTVAMVEWDRFITMVYSSVFLTEMRKVAVP